MDKTFVGLLSASAVALVGAAHASAAVTPGGEPDSLKPAQSFAELLDPIPNASGLLRAEDERADKADAQPVEMAQVYYYHHHHHHYHHHHHHHHWWHHHYHHHHHHHHHHMVVVVPQ